MSERADNTLNQCLRKVWLRAQRKHLLGGLLAFVRWFVPLFLLTIVIDRFAYFPSWLRALCAMALLLVAFRQAWRHGWSKLNGFNATGTAKQIERAAGGMDSLLVTAVQFDKSGATPGTSAQMWELTQRQAYEAASKVEPDKVVKLSDLKKPLRVFAGIAAVFLLLTALQAPFLGAGFGRLFTPWLTIAYPTDTIIEPGEGELVIKEGAPARIEIKLSGDIPETAELALQTGKGRPREIDLDVVEGIATYELASASRDFTYRVKAGDARSQWRPVRVIKAPRLAQVKVELDYPEYMERETEILEALTMTVPEETKVNWELTLDTAIREATLHRDGEEDTPLDIGEDKRTLKLSETAAASRGYSFSWVEDAHGFDFTSPRNFLQVSADQSPRVELTLPMNNLNAMIGRPVDLAVRASDDHGIGSTNIIYRVNRRPEKTVQLAEPVRNGGGEQVLDWDYREAVDELKIGDTVSFLVEVADKYPGEGGPHEVRTETRRITFLSREDYLAEITKQMERLLSRVRTLYRQQRTAHELMLEIDPRDDSFVPTCQLEAIRQEIVREQLVETADEVQALLEDLAANNVSEAVESEMLASLRDSLRSIANEDVARAADLLRAQVGAASRDPGPAVSAVNKAARELAALVMQRGIGAAREVFARETRMLSDELSRLRLALMTAAPEKADFLADRHKDVAIWTQTLLDQLSASMRYDEKALAVLGLSRRIHNLRTNGLIGTIRETAELAKAGEFEAAASLQYPLIRPLLESEFTMRSGSRYAQLRGLREQLTAIIADHTSLLADTRQAEDFDRESASLAARQTKLREVLVLADLPFIPAPRAGIFDMKLPPVPPSDAVRLEAEQHIGQAITQLQNGEQDAAVASQGKALTALESLDSILDVWSVELAKMALGVSASVTDARDRVGAFEQLEAQQIGLLEQTEEAAFDEKNPPSLLEDQKSLIEEVAFFRKELTTGDNENNTELYPLVDRLDAAAVAMNKAAGKLSASSLEDALEPQENAAVYLAEARDLAASQVVRLNLIQQLIGFQQSVARASDGMADVVGGQNDLIEATEVADEEALAALIPPQKNLLQCLSDIAPSLDLVAARLDVGTPLVFAASDVEDALLAMEDGDAEDAAEIQEIAVESLEKVNGLVSEIAVQTGYVAEVVEFLSDSQSIATKLAYRQRQLREAVDAGDLPVEQKKLSAEAAEYGKLLTEVAGRVDFDKLSEELKEKFEGMDFSLDFNTPALRMNEAGKALGAGEDASPGMASAEAALQSNSDQINVIIEMLNGLPSVPVNNTSEPELVRLIDVLDIASKQRVLLRRTNELAEEELPALATDQSGIIKKLERYREGELAAPELAAVFSRMETIPGALKDSNRSESIEAQVSADTTLRHFIVQWALVLNTAIPPTSSSDSEILTESETDDLYTTDPAGFVADFVSGEAPEDQESEWEILGTRNRAALNQNFARELPLEYRATLKNYYERVAE